MNISNIKRFLSLSLFILLSVQIASGQSGMGATLDKVEVESVTRYDTIPAGDEAQFAVVMDIEEGWHLNAHNPTLDYLIGVDLSMDASDHAIVSDIQYPKPLQTKFSLAEDVVDVYEGKPEILVQLIISVTLKPGTYPVAGDLQVQACCDKVCLPPSTVSINLPIPIGDKVAASEHTELFEELDQREATISSADDNEIASMFNEKGYFWAFFSIFLIDR